MIKTKEWLITSRKNANLTQQELADKIGVSVQTIAKIEQGQRVGAVETWEKINTLLDNEISFSYACDNMISEVEEDIELYGFECHCYLYYKLEKNLIIFTDYALDEDFEDESFKLNPGEQTMISTLSDALKIFKYQNHILK